MSECGVGAAGAVQGQGRGKLGMCSPGMGSARTGNREWAHLEQGMGLSGMSKVLTRNGETDLGSGGMG